MNKKNDQTQVTLFGESVTPAQKDSGDIIAGLFIISFGLILLGNNLGIISWAFWEAIVRFWPLMFVLMGVHVILGNRFIARSILFVVTLSLLGVVILFGLRATQWSYMPTLPEPVNQILIFMEGRL